MARLKDPQRITNDGLMAAIMTHDFPELAAASEEYYSRQLQYVIDELIAHREIRAIFISGPTNSGKTTSTFRLARELSRHGRPARMISLDDYYIEGALRYDAEGRPDFESVDTISLDMLAEDLRLLMNGRTAWIPRFDFTTRKRIFERDQKLKLLEHEVVLVEGLHALSPEIKTQLPEELTYGIFIMPNVEFETPKGIITQEETRKLRRIHRDSLRRNTRPLETIDFWPMVKSAEDVFVPQYLEEANVHINSSLPYEYALLGPKVKDLIGYDLRAYEQNELRPSPNVKEGLFYANIDAAVAEAKRLYDLIGSIPVGDSRVIPNDSILHEFL